MIKICTAIKPQLITQGQPSPSLIFEDFNTPSSMAIVSKYIFITNKSTRPSQQQQIWPNKTNTINKFLLF